MPAEYTSVKGSYPAQFKNEPWTPASSGYVLPTEFSSSNTAVTEELQWFIIYAENLSSELFNQNIYPPGWAAHHALHKRNIQTPPGINTILPLLQDKVSTFNMQAHLMQLYMKCTAVLNPGHTPVDVSDQPAYALTKGLQFRHPEMFSQFFPIFRQLHMSNLYW